MFVSIHYIPSETGLVGINMICSGESSLSF